MAADQESLQTLVLESIDKGVTGSQELSDVLKCEHQVIVGVLKSLSCTPNLIELEQTTEEGWKLTEEGYLIEKEGSYEKKLFDEVKNGTTKIEELMKLPYGKIGLSKAIGEGWIEMHKDATGGSAVRVNEQLEKDGKDVEDKVRDALTKIKEGHTVDKYQLEDCRRRKLIKQEKRAVYSVKKGTEFTTSIMKPEVDLTPEMIADGSWKTKTFKKLNFDAMGVMPTSGYLHPLLKIRAEYRQIFLEMGFSEMPTNRFVESSFWNFDALFQPQQHPARDAHDTFFLSDPATSSNFPEDYLEKVKQVHSKGGFGSQGYKYDWKREEAEKNILRTHTTAISTRMLYELGQKTQKSGFQPVKYFSIDRVFRNETLDATHLAEFHQIEGVVADRGLTLGDLMGVINEFFVKLGISKLRFKPAYNPYTEPSMEIFSYHDGLKKWVEVGNSGIFRPEMLLPMGLPEDVVVIAWGLSLERPTMIKYKIDNIRDLIGPKINLAVVQQNPVCRLGV